MKKRGPGRPPRAGVAAGQLSIRVTDAERAVWKKHADRCGASLAEWVRDLVNHQVRQLH